MQLVKAAKMRAVIKGEDILLCQHNYVNITTHAKLEVRDSKCIIPEMARSGSGVLD